MVGHRVGGSMKTPSERPRTPNGAATVAPAQMIRATLLVVAAGAVIGWQRCLVGSAVRFMSGMSGAGALVCGPVALARTVELVAALWLAYATLLWLGLLAAKARLPWERTLAITGDGLAAILVGAVLMTLATKLEIAPELALGAFWAGVFAWPVITAVRLGHVSGTRPQTVALVTVFAAVLLFSPVLVTIGRHPGW